MIENVLISVLLASVKCPEQEDSISHAAFMGNCPAINRTC